MNWTEISLEINADDIDKAAAIANMTVPYGIYIEDYRNLEEETWEIANIDLIDEELLKKDRTKGFIHIYIPEDENPSEAVSYLSERLKAENIPNKIDLSVCKNEDWENNWKEYFKPLKIGDKLLIRPLWIDDYDNSDNRAVLSIEPGLAFGTGGHNTTKLCLEALEKYVKKGSSVLDTGCGSGFKTVASSKRIASPGCYASGFIALVKPLLDEGIVSPDHGFICHAVSGYSGAGKKGIAMYESDEKAPELFAPREYALNQEHKHLKEMRKISGLSVTPIFCPYVCDYFSGMLVTVPVFKTDLKDGKTAEDIKAVYRSKYASDIVKYKEAFDNGGFVAANSKAELDSMAVTVAGNDDRLLLMALYDNLGKGASGAALECMNIVMGLPPEYGLDL